MTTATKQRLAIYAAFKCWHRVSGEFIKDSDRANWGRLFEPLETTAPENARPYCCYLDTVIFYGERGYELSRCTHHALSIGHPNLLLLENKWHEVISGEVKWRDGGWFMVWTLATNTRFANLLNSNQSSVETQGVNV